MTPAGIPDREQGQREKRAEGRQSHVLLSVPDIALRAQICDAQLAAEHRCGAPLDCSVK